MEVAKAARTTESLVVRVCGLGAAELEELATAQSDLNRWSVACCDDGGALTEPSRLRVCERVLLCLARGFDVLKFNDLVKGNALMAVGILLFGMHELPKSVAINQGTLCGFLQAIQSGYQCVGERGAALRLCYTCVRWRHRRSPCACVCAGWNIRTTTRYTPLT